MSDLMGRNEYARHRRCAPNAVKKAEDDGRIAAAVKREPDGSFVGIDWRKADELWAINTDPAAAEKSGASTAPPAAAPLQLPLVDSQGPPAETDTAATDVKGDRSDYYEHRAKREEFQAKNAELDYLKAIGRLVSVDELRLVASERYRAIRDKLLNIPDRVAAILAAQSDPAVVHTELTKEIKRVLHELSDDARAESARGTAERVAA